MSNASSKWSAPSANAAPASTETPPERWPLIVEPSVNEPPTLLIVTGPRLNETPLTAIVVSPELDFETSNRPLSCWPSTVSVAFGSGPVPPMWKLRAAATIDCVPPPGLSTVWFEPVVFSSTVAVPPIDTPFTPTRLIVPVAYSA